MCHVAWLCAAQLSIVSGPCRERRKREKQDAARAKQEAEQRAAAEAAAAAAAAEAAAAEEAAEARKLRQREKKAMQRERQRLRGLCAGIGAWLACNMQQSKDDYRAVCSDCVAAVGCILNWRVCCPWDDSLRGCAVHSLGDFLARAITGLDIRRVQHMLKAHPGKKSIFLVRVLSKEA